MSVFLLLSIIISFVNSVPINNKHLKNDLFEGDIVSDKGLAQKPTSEYSKWPEGIVPYMIDPLTYDKSHMNVILESMRSIENQTQINGKYCIKFVPRDDHTNYLRIFNGHGCYSRVGKQIEVGAQQLSLKRPTKSDPGSCVHQGIVIHELIHALGFWHEQSRPDRDRYVKINWENIDKENYHHFEKYTTNIDTLGTSYDYDSIMQYDSYAYSINGKPTIEPIKSDVQLVDDPDRYILSEIDIDEIRKYYNCI